MRNTWLPPADLDPECLALCKAINECVPGVATVESCCGHGTDPYRIWVWPETAEAMLPLLYRLDSCHSGLKGWRTLVYTDCGMSHVTWMVEGPAGAYVESGKIAQLLRDDVPIEPAGSRR